MLYTIGHSNHPADRFVALLKSHGIRLLADIRSQPASRFSPQFNRTGLAVMLETSGISYQWLGDRLGGLPRDPAMYDVHGRPDYVKMAATPAFGDGIDELFAAAAKAPTAIMCAERDPQKCHRNQLVTPALMARGAVVQHIQGDGTLIPAAQQQPVTQQYKLFD
jgi:uncharacterized protein (DUF488 family)